MQLHQLFAGTCLNVDPIAHAKSPKWMRNVLPRMVGDSVGQVNEGRVAIEDVSTSGARGGRLGEDALVIGFVAGDDVIGAEFFLGVDACDLAHFTAAIGAGEKVNGVGCGGFHVAGFDEETIHAVFDDFGNAANVRGDDRNAACHGFESGKAEGFQLRWEKEDVGEGEEIIDVVLFAEEVDVFLNFLFPNEIFRGATVRAVADEEELRWHLRADQSKNFNGIGKTFHRTEIR